MTMSLSAINYSSPLYHHLAFYMNAAGSITILQDLAAACCGEEDFEVDLAEEYARLLLQCGGDTCVTLNTHIGADNKHLSAGSSVDANTVLLATATIEEPIHKPKYYEQSIVLSLAPSMEPAKALAHPAGSDVTPVDLCIPSSLAPEFETSTHAEHANDCEVPPPDAPVTEASEVLLDDATTEQCPDCAADDANMQQAVPTLAPIVTEAAEIQQQVSL
jgi:hypothetical protein